MTRGIFLIGANNALTELRETPYDSEALLQQLLADHPNILAGEEERSGTPHRWLLLTREASVPDSLDSGGRWSIDHVFLDQDAVPTLVEVKRSTDSRIRREVVGQMLDYAANAMVYWPPNGLRQTYEQKCQSRGVEPGEDLRRTFGDPLDQEDFWERAKTNLGAGHIRLVFVSDEIPPELRRIVEFLNGQMDPAEVLAVEVRQFAGNGLRTLVPTVLGQTAESQQRKGSGRVIGAQWDRSRFMTVLREKCGEQAALTADEILTWADHRASRLSWGSGAVYGGVVPILEHNGVDHQMFALYTNGSLEVYFQYYLGKRPFEDESMRRELLCRLNSIPSVRIPADALRRRPSIPIAALSTPEAIKGFFAAYNWYCDQVISAPPI
jgi:hypothetical protein